MRNKVETNWAVYSRKACKAHDKAKEGKVQ